MLIFENAATEPMTILLIDDQPDVIKFLSLLLDPYGQIVFAKDGQAGVARAMSLVPDLILLDIQMPGIDGFEVCRQLKASPVTAAIPVLFVTSGNDEAMEVAALEAGAIDFITKPLRPQVVRARVAAHLALRRQNVDMQRLVDLDGLTRIYNRRYFDAMLEIETSRHRRHGAMLTLAMIDVDHFKRYNDALGHQAGDDCLCQVARALKLATRRPGETLARYGGEEFAAILPGCGYQDADSYGLWITRQINALRIVHPDSPTSGFVSISVGLVAGVPGEGVQPRDLLRAADAALYSAKRDGRNTHRLVGADQSPA
ncbi:MAG: diguanylate cyclase [Pseudomonadota bacterium]